MSKKAPVYKVTVTLITREAITGDVQAFAEWVLDTRLEDESFVVSFSVDDVEEIGGAKGNAVTLEGNPYVFNPNGPVRRFIPPRSKEEWIEWATELEKFSKQLPSWEDLMKESNDE